MEESDAEAVAALSEQLGYRIPPEQRTARIRAIREIPGHLVLVAVLGHRVVGWIDACITQHLVTDPYLEICGLIVDAEMRSQRIGQQLLQRAESWGSEQGLGTVLVRSRESRDRAHEFYLRQGYRRVKVSHVFDKPL